MTAPFLRLDSPVQHYAWGSTEIIPALLGREPTGDPVAELWLGAHPAAPSMVPEAGGARSLQDLIAEQPGDLLGDAVAQRFGRLPFLLKILAVEHPLSLQAHPSLAQAAAGFAAENAAGVPLDAANRNYRDDNHKPEQVCALTDFDGLCGFRAVADTSRFLAALSVEGLTDVQRRLETSDDALATIVAEWLTAPVELVTALLAEVVPAAACLESAGGDWAAEAGWIVRLHEEYPNDRGTLIALLLNLVRLAPGQALFLRAGELHAYLRGAAVEVMANSDNVLRGGLTGKHIDVAALMDVLDVRASTTAPTTPEPAPDGTLAYPTGVADFRLARIDFDGFGPAPAVLAAGLPRILLCTSGYAVVATERSERRSDHEGSEPSDLVDDDRAVLRAGDGLFVPARSRVSVSGVAGEAGSVFIAAANLDPPA